MEISSKHSKRQKWGEISILFVAIVLLITVFIFLKMNKKIVQLVDVRQAQVSSLIQELGEVRQENLYLKSELEEQEQNLSEWMVSQEKFSKRPVGAFSLSSTAPSLPIASSFSQALPLLQADSSRFVHILIAGHHQKLTDTIMVASLDREKNRITLLSVPRDLSVNGRKINEYYFYYGALELAKQIEGVTGISFNHYAVVSMEAFEKFIDALGGIDVEVEKPISDALFPNATNGYDPFYLPEGSQHLDGVIALKFARSRKGNSDFDRAKRQQQVIHAVLEKIRAGEFLRDLTLTKKLYESVGSLFETNIGLLDALLLFQTFSDAELRAGNVLSDANFLYPTRNLKDQFILLPRKSDFSEVRAYYEELLLE